MKKMKPPLRNFLNRLPLQCHRIKVFMKNSICTNAIAGMLLSGRIFFRITGTPKNGWIFLTKSLL